MPVTKYRDVSVMPDVVRLPPGSPELLRAMRATWEFAERALRPRFPPGVYKHRSIVALQRQREEWDRANREALRKRRAAGHG